MQAPQRIPQLRLLVNNRCGRKCIYCRPSGEGCSHLRSEQLTVQEALDIAGTYRLLGGENIKISGGDPALWPGLVECTAKLKSKVGMDHIEVLSRHPKFGPLAKPLAHAGADVLNMSIDTLRPDLHKAITGCDDWDAVMYALQQCCVSDADVKVNIVVMKNVNDREIPELIHTFEQMGVKSVKLLDVIQDLHEGNGTNKERLHALGVNRLTGLYTDLGWIAEWLSNNAITVGTQLQGGLGHPMQIYRLPSGLSVVLKDHCAGAWYGAECASCRHYPCHDALMALRCTADCKLQFCLLRDDNTIDLRHAVKECDQRALCEAMELALSRYQDAYFMTPTEEVDACANA